MSAKLSQNNIGQQQAVELRDEWDAAQEEVEGADYVIMDGELYSLILPFVRGTTERFNRTLKDTLCKTVNNDVSGLEDQLAPALLAYRISDGRTRGSNPYHILFGVEPNVDSAYQTGCDRLEEMQKVRQASRLSQIRGKKYRQERGPNGRRQIIIGDYVTLNCAEPQTLTHLRDGALKVISVRGNVVGVVPLANPLHKAKYYHANRLRTVPPTLAWEDINPRVRRYAGPSDARTLDLQDFTEGEYVALPASNPTSIRLQRKRTSTQPNPQRRRQAKKSRIATLSEITKWFAQQEHF